MYKLTKLYRYFINGNLVKLMTLLLIPNKIANIFFKQQGNYRTLEHILSNIINY